MDATLEAPGRLAQQNQTLADTFAAQSGRLRRFIRGRVADPGDAEDILQEVFHELVEAQRVLHPIEQVGAWLFRVARNRITDLLRRRRTRGVEWCMDVEVDDDGDAVPALLGGLLQAAEGPPDLCARRMLLDALEDALDELPAAQREVFIAHEIEGRSFKSLAAESGVAMNTLLSRKHGAVLHLRRRLQAIYDDFVQP
jgi:RNA polymerase sigma factor (sigma-70 family)